jgi:3-oxoacyl-[acyl-carrier protein] reductase
MDLELKGKIVFITGASSGIGAACVEIFAQEGAFVVIGYNRQKDAAERLLEKIRLHGASGITVHLDLSVPKSIEDCKVEVVKKVGKIDVLVMNAAQSKMTPFDDISGEEWDELFAINLKGPYLMLKAWLQYFNVGGTIVFVSSIAGQTGAPGHAHYAASKAGLINLAKSAAKFKAESLRINCVAPGVTMTALGKDAVEETDPEYAKKLLSRRLAEPKEIARVIVFLASPASSFVWGATIDVNGGRELR